VGRYAIGYDWAVQNVVVSYTESQHMVQVKPKSCICTLIIVWYVKIDKGSMYV